MALNHTTDSELVVSSLAIIFGRVAQLTISYFLVLTYHVMHCKCVQWYWSSYYGLLLDNIRLASSLIPLNFSQERIRTSD